MTVILHEDQPVSTDVSTPIGNGKSKPETFDGIPGDAQIFEDEKDNHTVKKLLYSLSDNPPWYTCIALGLQHFLLMVESTVSIPYIVTPLMCMADTDPNRGYVAATIIFVSGLVTILQTTFGVRLPIIQGGSHTFLGPTFAILATMPCPSDDILDAMSPEEREEAWQLRMRTVQGCICVAAIFQVIVGSTGIAGLLLKWITPLTITPTVTLIGLSLFRITAKKASSNWLISSLTVVLLVLFSQYLANISVPLFTFSKKGFRRTKLKLFQLFPVLLTLVITWITCLFLTEYDVFSPDNKARTDLRLNMISEASWFILPYPGQFGVPIPTIAGVLGVTAGIFASIIESIGDYYACARLAGAPPPPKHALNRGIWIEGVGTVLAGVFGTASGTTSFSQNVGAIGITGVGSRRVVLFAGMIMLACGLVGKIGALFINIPEPIIGGIFVVVFSMITSVGLSSLQFVNLNSSRNLFVLGISLFIGIALPEWMNLDENKGVIQTSIKDLDQILTLLLKIPMFVGGILGFILDNTVPGTKKERGLLKWEEEFSKKTKEDDTSYDLPIGMSLIKKLHWTKWIPMCPTFTGWPQWRRRGKVAPAVELVGVA